MTDDEILLLETVAEGEPPSFDSTSYALKLDREIREHAQGVKDNLYQLCKKIAIIDDDNLYVLLGRTTFRDYAAQRGINYNTARRYRIVGRYIHQLEECSALNTLQEPLDDLSVTKLFELATTDPGELSALSERHGGQAALMSMSTREIKTAKKEFREELREKMQQQNMSTDPQPETSPEPEIDSLRVRWVGMLHELDTLCYNMDMLFRANAEELEGSETPHYFNRIRTACRRDLAAFDV